MWELGALLFGWLCGTFLVLAGIVALIMYKNKPR